MEQSAFRERIVDGLSNWERWDSALLAADLKLYKALVARSDQEELSRVWCLEQVVAVHGQYIEAFRKLKNGLYYDGWCLLDRADTHLHWLSKHQDVGDSSYELSWVQQAILGYQGLFPYKLFLSPEIHIIEKVCGTCGQVVSLTSHCGHRVGDLYDGELCTRRITKSSVRSISLVSNPAQKYSVLFMRDGDHYDYSAVNYVVKRLASPYNRWRHEWTRRQHPHSFYADTSSSDPCPCESGQPYARCCKLQAGVWRPHCQVKFERESQPAYSMDVSFHGYAAQKLRS